jgi:hypothetical protein
MSFFWRTHSSKHAKQQYVIDDFQASRYNQRPAKRRHAQQIPSQNWTCGCRQAARNQCDAGCGGTFRWGTTAMTYELRVGASIWDGKLRASSKAIAQPNVGMNV